MVRKHLYIALGILLSFNCLNSCSKDKGNYNYTTLDEIVIDTTGIAALRIMPRFDTLKINPSVRYKGQVITSNSNPFPELAFSWVMYPTILERNNELYNLDSTVRLKVPITAIERTYEVLFTVTNKNTNVKAFAKFTVSVTSNLPEGWMVLYERNGNTDVGMIVNDRISKNLVNEGLYMDLCKATNGASYPGRPVSITYSMTNFASKDYRILLATENNVALIDATNFKHKKSMRDSLFFTIPSTIKPSMTYANESRKEFIINNNRVHMLDFLTILTGPREFDFGVDPGGTIANYIPSSFLQSGYQCVVYNQTTKSFKKLTTTSNAFINFPAQSVSAPFDLNNVGMKLQFGDMGRLYYDYMVMQDEINSKYYLVAADFRTPESVNMAKGKYNMTAAPEVASIIDVTAGYNGEVFYYTSGGNKMYQFKYSTEVTETSWTAPGNEKITCIQLQKYTSTNTVPVIAALYDPKNANKILYIATYDEATSNGKVYEMFVDPSSGAIIAGTEKVYTGFGKVKMMAWKPYFAL